MRSPSDAGICVIWAGRFKAVTPASTRNTGLITEDQVNDALQYLRDSAPKAAIAKAQARTLEKYCSVVEAEQKLKATGRSNAAAQDEARASLEYKQTLLAWEEAIRKDAEFTMLREAASSRIEAWRTMCSNARSEGRAYS